MSRILTPKGWRKLNEEVELDEMKSMSDDELTGMTQDAIKDMKRGMSQKEALKKLAKEMGATRKETAKVKQMLDRAGFKEEVELEEDVLTEEELEFATEEIVNALNVLIDYDIIDESALNELSPSTISSYAKNASGERRKWTKHIIPIRKTM